MSAKARHVVSIGLSAAIVSVADERPCVLVVHHQGGEDALPFGPFDPLNHRTLDSGLRRWVGEQTYLELGYADDTGDCGFSSVANFEAGRAAGATYCADCSTRHRIVVDFGREA